MTKGRAKREMKAAGSEEESGAKKDSGAAAEMFAAAAFETLTDIVKHSTNLLNPSRTAQDRRRYQVIDPRTVASTLQEFVGKPTGPGSIIDQQFDLWSDLTLLWQRTAARTLFNMPADLSSSQPKRQAI